MEAADATAYSHQPIELVPDVLDVIGIGANENRREQIVDDFAGRARGADAVRLAPADQPVIRRDPHDDGAVYRRIDRAVSAPHDVASPVHGLARPEGPQVKRLARDCDDECVDGDDTPTHAGAPPKESRSAIRARSLSTSAQS